MLRYRLAGGLLAAAVAAGIAGDVAAATGGSPFYPARVALGMVLLVVVLGVHGLAAWWLFSGRAERRRLGAGLALALAALTVSYLVVSARDLVAPGSRPAWVVLGAWSALGVVAAGAVAGLALWTERDLGWRVERSPASLVALAAAVVIAFVDRLAVTTTVRTDGQTSSGLVSVRDLFVSGPVDWNVAWVLGLLLPVVVAVLALGLRPRAVGAAAGAGLAVVVGAELANTWTFLEPVALSDSGPLEAIAFDLTGWFWVEVAALLAFVAALAVHARGGGWERPAPIESDPIIP